MATHYSVLGVAQTADVAAIKASYNKLVLKTHPDKGGKAEEFIRVHAAYEVLSDAAARAAYDQELRKQFPRPRSPFTTPPSRPVPAEFASEPGAEARYAFHRTYNTDSTFSTGSPPQRAPRQPRGAAARDGPGPSMRENEHQPEQHDAVAAAMRAELDLVKQFASEATCHFTTVEQLIRSVCLYTGDYLPPNLWECLTHFKGKLKSNKEMLGYRQLSLSALVGGGPSAYVFGFLPAWDLEDARRGMADLSRAVRVFSGMVLDVRGVAMQLRDVLKRADAVEADRDELERQLEDSLEIMKGFLELLLYRKYLWVEERNKRTFGA